MRVVQLLCFLLWGHFLFSQQTYFNVQFDYNNYWEYSALSSIENDSFYLLPAASGTPWANIWDTAFVLKVDKYNAAVQYKKIGFFEGQSAVNLRKTSNSSRFLLQGRKYPGHSGTYVDTDIYMCYLKNGSLDTSNLKIYGLPNRNDNFYRPLPTSDGGFFSSGWSWDINSNPSFQSILLFKCDSNLNQQFLKLYPANPTGHHFGGGAIETPDKSVIVMGTRWIGTDSKANAIYFKVDTLGNLQWWKEIPFDGDTTFLVLSDIVSKANGTYLAIGSRTFNPQVGPAHQTFWLVNMDGNGNVLWQKEYDPNFYASWERITPSLDGNFYACGVATIYDPDLPTGFAQHAVISKLSPEGGLLWHRKYTMSPSGKYYDIFFNVLATSDGGILCNGTTYENDTTRQNAWVVKLDGNGCIAPGPGCSTDSEEPIELPVGQNAWVAISPNPTSGLLRIEAKGERHIEALRIFDPAGRLVQERHGLREKVLEADLGSGPAGVYVVSVLVDGVWNVRQVVKTNKQ